ncbi:MAG: GNAT family N-acetyltransferase [Oscillospiraceae bacterium]|nr:GNAT family N-acetyltransferase [Oscillospiraceae bacterium]
MLKLIFSMAELDAEQLLDVYKEHNWDEVDFLSYLREDFFCQPGAFYAIWSEDAIYKSAVRLESYRDGLLLHSLETAPADRRKGYGYQLLSYLSDYLRTTECKAVYSHIEKHNKASLALHMKCGFEIISDSATYLDGTVTQYSNTLRICL